MAGSQGGGGNTSSGRTRSRAADHHAHVDDEENVFGDLRDFVDVDPNPPLLVDEIDAADPNAFPQQNPTATEGSGDAMAAAPIAEGRRKRARLNPVQNQNPPPPQDPIEHPPPIRGMPEIPSHLRHRQLYQLCRKRLSNSDLNKCNLMITGGNRSFLKQKASEASLALGPGLGVHAQLLNNGPAPTRSAFVMLNNPGGSGYNLTLAWKDLIRQKGVRLAEKQYINMWFEMTRSSMNIYILPDKR